MFLASNLLNFADLVENESLKSIYKKNYQYSYFYLIYQEIVANELDNYKNPHHYSVWLIMNNQSSNFRGEGS